MNLTAPVTDITPQRPKIPLNEAAGMLAEWCHRLDDGEEPNAIIQKLFSEARLDVAAAIDRRRAFKAVALERAATARAMAKELTEVAARAEAAVAALSQNTLKIMLDYPELPYRDSVGRKLSVVPNPPKLVLNPGSSLGEKKITNIVDSKSADELAIYGRYLKTVSYVVLDTEQLKADLLAGAEVPWASIVIGTHLRGL